MKSVKFSPMGTFRGLGPLNTFGLDCRFLLLDTSDGKVLIPVSVFGNRLPLIEGPKV